MEAYTNKLGSKVVSSWNYAYDDWNNITKIGTPDNRETGYKAVTELFRFEKKKLIYLTIGEEEIVTTEEHPFWVDGYGFVEAGHLTEGCHLENAKGELLPLSGMEVKYPETPVTVYNLEVEDWHTYYVSDEEVFVHNMCAIKAIESGKDTTRVRHYTNSKGLKGIEESGTIMAKDNNRVYLEMANKKPLSSLQAEEFYQLGRGKEKNYVEFDVDSSLLEWIENPRYHRMELTVKGDVGINNAKFYKRVK